MKVNQVKEIELFLLDKQKDKDIHNVIEQIIKKCFNIDESKKELVESIDVRLFILLLKILCKKKNQNDIFVQFFETKIIRPNAYKINNLNDLLDLITNEDRETKESKWSCFYIIIQEIIKVIDNYNNKIRNNEFENNNVLIDGIVSSIENNIEDIKNKENSIQLTFDNIPQNKKIKLSPTTGIQQLNNNPYSFFVSKILDLTQLCDWQMKIDSTIYGNLVHSIAQKFTDFCKKQDLSIFEKEKNIFNIDAVRDFNNFFKNAISQSFIFKSYWNNVEYQCKKYGIKNNKFFLIKFINIFICLSKIEYEAKQENREVLAEISYNIEINNVIITAKADRVEFDHKKKLIYIYDYKTGDVKTKKQNEKNGEQPQLSVIATILKTKKIFCDYQIVRMRYVCLNGNEIINNYADVEIECVDETRKNLFEMIEVFFVNGKPKIEKMNFIMQSIAMLKLYNKDKIIHLARDTRMV